jgi:hypothetical protein
MTPQVKNQLIVVGTATGIGFLQDAIMYSIAVSKGGKFRFQIPKGKQLAQVLIVGALTGLIIDFAVTQISNSLKMQEEKELDKLVKAEKNRIYSGEVKGQSPEEVVCV